MISYGTAYDIATEPPFDVVVAWLSGGIVLLGIIWHRIQRAKDRKLIEPPKRSGITAPKLLIGFGLVIALLGIGLMGWDHWRLVEAIKSGEARMVEGPIQSWGTERVRTANTKKVEYRTYERFYVGDSIWFGYYWDVGQAGFHNAGIPPIQLKDGLFARATYLFADGTDAPPRIVKLELDEQP
ncbi:MAG: hypothetical protein IPP33_12630 [Flavobacteriales bacterium]|nr:hypothetical protein [Flavobacteriales bacterium]